ncbi:MAG: bifunctional phosphoribosylaminoimidazolecarboxamide formyltransferase/IMP cyclohydrolase [Actinomycetaceae bacterium]|nr:bifunctional phosphoribosylaminoimidazolecarboxamide formyltransferase/IMP cyclohydrolase [Actinomycetaceae bacterium]
MKIPFKRALISVYDKTGVEELARGLADAGCEIISTGSTASVIEKAGVKVTTVDSITQFPECFDGRVKTLHPLIHGGILADRRLESHRKEMDELSVNAIDLVVVNLYPFQETVASGASIDECIEKIDIGGPTMVRAAAKNHASVAIVVNPEKYDDVVKAAHDGGFTDSERQKLAYQAFVHTAQYDVAVASWMGSALLDADYPLFVGGAWEQKAQLRYGENSHQVAAVYTDSSETGLAHAQQLGGKEMSYNNFQDTDAALRAAYDHEDACVAIIKHANPCGVAISDTGDIAQAHRKAHACDPVSAYGGVIAANRVVNAEMAAQIKPIFTECIAAPGYDPDALEILQSKKNLRILIVQPQWNKREIKPISGGVLVQDRDIIDAEGDDPKNWRLVAGEAADEKTLKDLVFAWRTIRSVKSNAILLARDGGTVGVGMGQVNRVDSCRLAVERANTLGIQVESSVDSAGGAENSEGVSQQRALGAVAASDAFFPFADGFEVLAQAGIKAVVHPGGSIRDDEVIEAAKKAGVTMYMTGARHFFH